MRKNIIEKIFHVGLNNGYNLELVNELLFRAIIKISEHSRNCKSRFFEIKDGSIYCKVCRKGLLNFCPVCGSTKLTNQDLTPMCRNCGYVFEKLYLVQ